MPGGFPWSAFGFGSKGGPSEDAAQEEKFSNQQFGSMFEDMMQDEGMAEDQGRPTGKFWSIIGGLSGGAMGFIVANFPGAAAGAVAGNRLGAVRDTKGKSVYSVFQVSRMFTLRPRSFICSVLTNYDRSCHRVIRRRCSAIWQQKSSRKL